MEREVINNLICAERSRHFDLWRNDYYIKDFNKMVVLVIEELGEAIQEFNRMQEILDKADIDDVDLDAVIDLFDDSMRKELIEAIALMYAYLEGLD